MNPNRVHVSWDRCQTPLVVEAVKTEASSPFYSLFAGLGEG